MPDIILIDTDILIDVGRKAAEAVSYLEHAEQKAVIGISLITQMELVVGCRNKSELNALEKFLRRFEIISLNESISFRGVNLLREYRLSHGLLIADSLIAATAITIAAPLATKNQQDYKFINGLELFSYPNLDF